MKMKLTEKDSDENIYFNFIEKGVRFQVIIYVQIKMFHLHIASFNHREQIKFLEYLYWLFIYLQVRNA